jgi:hypothetical protein
VLCWICTIYTSTWRVCLVKVQFLRLREHLAPDCATVTLGQLPLDPELARCCDAGEIEDYAVDVFEPIAAKIAERASARPSTPIF